MAQSATRSLCLLLAAVTLAGCGDLFGRSAAPMAQSDTARCDAALQGAPRPQATAILGRETAVAGTRGEAFDACMTGAGWRQVAATPAAPATVVTIAGRTRRPLGLEVAPMPLPFAAAGYARGAPGLVVLDIQPGGAAQAAGLRRGDILLAFAGSPVGGPAAIQNALNTTRAGSRVPVELWRDQAPMLATLAF